MVGEVMLGRLGPVEASNALHQMQLRVKQDKGRNSRQGGAVWDRSSS